MSTDKIPEPPKSPKTSEKQGTTRINRARKELISNYATAAVFLYGVLSVDEFVEVFNHYESDQTDSNEALLALQRLAKTDDVEYSISGLLISGPDLQPDFDDYEANVKAVRAAQRGKPRYLPEKKEFLNYATGDHREPEQPYAELKAHILKNKLTVRGEGLDGVDGDLIDLHEMIQFGVGTRDLFDSFTEKGYIFNGIDDLNAFARQLMNVSNNTRLYENNGFTPDELFAKSERYHLLTLPDKPFTIRPADKVGRNDPCPCGSGKKFKNCCGK